MNIASCVQVAAARVISWFCQYDALVAAHVAMLVRVNEAASKIKATEAMIIMHAMSVSATARANALKAQQLLLDLNIESKIASNEYEVVLTWTEAGKAGSFAWPVWPRS